jgi:lysozyme
MTNDRVTLNANQYGAVVSWSFNAGCNAARSSQLLRRLNAGERPSVVLPEELIKWINDNNGPVEGLRRRRRAEIALSRVAMTVVALPPAC